MKTGNILWRVVLLAICVITSILTCNIYGMTDSGGGGAEYFIVSFDSRGGSSVLEQEILSGERSLEPVDMQNGELVFSGWYQEETCDNCWNFDDPVTETLTLYAKWSPADSLTFTLINSDTEYEVSMGSGAFDADLYIPAYYQGIPVTQIAGWALYQCNSLTEVRLSSGVVNIGDCAFTLSSLQSISLPASLQVIGASAFSSSSLTYVE